MVEVPYEVYIRAFSVACYGESDRHGPFFTKEGRMFMIAVKKLSLLFLSTYISLRVFSASQGLVW